MMKTTALLILFQLSITLLLSSVAAADFDPRPAAKKIDSFLNAHLKGKELAPNPTISDEQFLRRTYLTIIGRVPTIEETNQFLEPTDPEKHSRLIQKLLANDAGYTAHHFQFWADLLRVQEGVHWTIEYKEWIKKKITANTPYDDMVRQLVSGHGLVFDNPAAGYYIRDTGMPLDNMSNTVRIFLGTRLECAQCHAHPFDTWTQMDFFKMAAFTYGYDHRGGNPHRSGIHQALRAEEKAAYLDTVGVKGFPSLDDGDDIDTFLSKQSAKKFLKRSKLTEARFRELALRGIAARTKAESKNEPVYGSIGKLYNQTTYLEVRHLSDTDLKLPHDYQYADADPHDLVKPATMFGADISPSADPSERKKAYANWLTSPENPRFTRVIVNRLWKRTFGYGLFEPVDDLSEISTIDQPDLLAYLEELMREVNYDLRAFQNVLFHTELFRREMHGEDHFLGTPFPFTGPLMQRMSGEQIWDSIATLIIPGVDKHAPNRQKTLDRMARMRATYHSLNGRPIEEVLPRMKKVGELRGKLYAEQADYEKRITDAYDAGDNDKAKALTAELKMKDREFIRRSREIVLVDLEGGQTVPAAMMAGMTADFPADSSTQIVKSRARKPPEGLDASERKEWIEREKTNLRHFNETARGMARAVELESPAKRGHFLRDFGQSDRDVIENASSNASVPQALYLLNSPLSIAISNPNAVLGKQLEAVSSPEEKIETIYRAMLTRKPTQREVERILTNFEAHGEETIEDLVWALLNSRQFLFIQ